MGEETNQEEPFYTKGGETMNKYLCFYNGRRLEVDANTSLEAQFIAAKKMKARKAYQVAILLVEKSGQPIVIDTASL